MVMIQIPLLETTGKSAIVGIKPGEKMDTFALKEDMLKGLVVMQS